ncbi:hypothetical protein ACFOWZ_04235 [Lentzea rhizosphaerae]|uniref:Uncharacterized protein n=1 Tax=Lentzea rhizosphaerae TaxID=2041025 RepID=A0ABV8BMY4_9PSEU
MRESTARAVTEISCFAFAGTPDSVTRSVYALPRTIVGHTWYALLVESERAADIRVFSRTHADDDSGPVASWHGASLGALPIRIMSLLMNAGDGIEAALGEHGGFVEHGLVPCPPTPRGAFGHALGAYAADRSVRAFVIAL